MKALRKPLSLFMAMLMCLGIFAGTGTTAFAAGETMTTYMVEFPRASDPNKAGWGHSAMNFLGGWSTGENNGFTIHTQDSFNGKVIYCIEPGVSVHSGDQFTGRGEDFWDDYPSDLNPTIPPDTIKEYIGRIMTYGWQGNASSKAPVRVADDVDETALSYSEIKALATGNPLIIEKCNLDMEVARLNMLKASHLNQVYALEELVYRKYPEEITRLTERIAGYEQDVALAAAHPKAQEGFCGMEVDGRHYTEKEGAGKAIIDVCTRMTGSDAVLLGQYRGFSMVLAYDGRSNEYTVQEQARAAEAKQKAKAQKER